MASASTQVTPSPHVEVLEGGLVLIRNFLPVEEQKKLVNGALQWGSEGEDGFFEMDPETGKRNKLNAENGRGRIYDAITRFPSWTKDLATSAVKLATDADDMMPSMDVTHLLLNMYTSANGLVWHRDIYENDGKSDHPVVNISVGASCKFGVRHENESGVPGDTEREIELHSGDVILFGGRCRFIKHAVLEVMMDTCPEWMETPCRFSFTFRNAPEIIGREHEFKFFKCSEHLVDQDKFKQPTDASKFEYIQSQVSQSKKRCRDLVDQTFAVDQTADKIDYDHHVRPLQTQPRRIVKRKVSLE